MADKRRAKVLIVEDSSIDRENYRRLLSRNAEYEFDVRECESGDDALAAFRAEKPDCILLDYNLPDTDGIEFLSAIQAESPDYAIPVVVMLTGQGTSAVAVEAIRRGAMDYLVKSKINSDTLNASVNLAISNNSVPSERLVQKFSVLLVDDNPNDRDLYKRLLRESTHNRFTFVDVGSGLEGIEEFQRSRPDCILLDYNLPDIDGLEFLTTLADIQDKAALPMPVVVMLTGQGTEAIAVEAMKRGAQDYLMKGELTREALHRSVAMAIEKRSLLTRLTDKEREFEQFSYAVAHDLQAPLRRTRSFCSLLLDSAGPHLQGSEKQYLELISQNVTSLQSMIHDLLGYYSADHVNEPKASVDMNAVVKKAVDNLADMLRERHAEVDIGRLPNVMGHQALLILLFQNLIQNGVKFNKSPVPRIEVRCFTSLRHLLFTVRDNGIGLAAENCKRVFKPFQRLHTVDEYPGSGLGLSICQKTTRLHGGHIWIDSAPGGGTVFNVQLPSGDAT